MACDLQMTEGNMKWKCKTKIYKCPAHPNTYPHSDFLVGFAGSLGDIISVADYFCLPDVIKPPKVGKMAGVVLTKDKKIFLFDSYREWIEVSDPFAACGSGTYHAMGAMDNGATPRKAIKTASKFDPYTGMGIKVLSFS